MSNMQNMRDHCDLVLQLDHCSNALGQLRFSEAAAAGAAAAAAAAAAAEKEPRASPVAQRK